MSSPDLRSGVAVCPLCGGAMHDSTGGCTTCALHSGCSMLCCVRCGYTTVAPQSKIVNFFKRLFRTRRRESDPPALAGTSPLPVGSERPAAAQPPR